MITIVDNVTRFEGDIQKVTTEMTILLSAFKEMLSKDYDFSNKQCNTVLAKLCEIAFMDNYERKEYLEELERIDG